MLCVVAPFILHFPYGLDRACVRICFSYVMINESGLSILLYFLHFQTFLSFHHACTHAHVSACISFVYVITDKSSLSIFIAFFTLSDYLSPLFC